MAAPLGQVVFKVPELGKAGYELELREQAAQEKKEQRREAEVYRAGGEKEYSDNIYQLQGRYKEDAELLYKKLEDYGTKYEMTGDASALRMVNQISSQIKGVVNDYNTQIGMAVKNAEKADGLSWEGYVGDRDSFDERISEVLNPSEITGRKFENGQILYQINGEYVPRTQTDYGSQKPNEKNTVLVQQASELGKYVVPSYYESQNKFLSINATSAENASNSVLNEFRYEYPNNPELQADVAVAYAIKKRGLDPNKISATEVAKIVARFQDDEIFRKEALDFYESKLSAVAVNRYGSKSQDVDVKLVPREGEGQGQETVVDSDTPAEETAADGVETAEETPARRADIPDGGLGLDLAPVAKKEPSTTPQPTQEESPRESEVNEQVEEQKPKAQGEQPQFGPPSPQQVMEQGAAEVAEAVEEVGDTQFEETEEEFDPSFGINEQTLDVVRIAEGGEGKRDVVQINRTLPEYYTNNLLEFEGGQSTTTGDAAYNQNPDAPVVNGERVHTNIGVTWNKYKAWAKKFGIPESQIESRFLNLKPNEALAVAEYVSSEAGASNFKNPALNALYTQNAWAGGSPFLATKGSNEYRALSVLLKKNGVKLDSNLSNISKSEAEQITALFEKNPKKFIDDYFDAYMISHSRMNKDLKYKGKQKANWDINKGGWYDRANKFKKALAEQLGIEFTDIDKTILDREYKEKNSKGEWVLYVPNGKNYWDDYQPIN